ncbi:hypothetical protein BpHYR1_022481 [Brachionus plicatilis]|uniref:Uncharacterized protein n=1 Tax=Brachionus plicatilis TaxID=10195 RepID=A0A3M7Q016_BRAPC|nr:hypothetical protein BpHYR1_022481 [Brachionus plicatilis]
MVSAHVVHHFDIKIGIQGLNTAQFVADFIAERLIWTYSVISDYLTKSADAISKRLKKVFSQQPELGVQIAVYIGIKAMNQSSFSTSGYNFSNLAGLIARMEWHMLIVERVNERQSLWFPHMYLLQRCDCSNLGTNARARHSDKELALRQISMSSISSLIDLWPTLGSISESMLTYWSQKNRATFSGCLRRKSFRMFSKVFVQRARAFFVKYKELFSIQSNTSVLVACVGLIF